MKSRVVRYAFRLGLILFHFGPGLAHFGCISPMSGLASFALGLAMSSISSALLLIGLIRAGTRSTHTHKLLWRIAMTLGWCVILVKLGIPLVRYAAINDVSTDLVDPPAFVHAAELPENAAWDMEFAPSLKAAIEKAYPGLQPLHLDEPPEAAFQRALALVWEKKDWRVAHAFRDDLTIEGTAISRIFRFPDDFVIRVRPKNGGSVVDMRSKSRYGQSDLGANAERITSFLDKLRR